MSRPVHGARHSSGLSPVSRSPLSFASPSVSTAVPRRINFGARDGGNGETPFSSKGRKVECCVSKVVKGEMEPATATGGGAAAAQHYYLPYQACSVLSVQPAPAVAAHQSTIYCPGFHCSKQINFSAVLKLLCSNNLRRVRSVPYLNLGTFPGS